MTDPSNPIQYPEWQHEYYAALVEFDPQKLLGLIISAETAIFKRLQAMSVSAKDRQVNLFKTRLFLIVAFLVIIAPALALHKLLR